MVAAAEYPACSQSTSCTTDHYRAAEEQPSGAGASRRSSACRAGRCNRRYGAGDFTWRKRRETTYHHRLMPWGNSHGSAARVGRVGDLDGALEDRHLGKTAAIFILLTIFLAGCAGRLG